MPIKQPIIISAHGDIDIFETVEHACGYLEAIDVINNEYCAFDSEGRLLRLDVTDRGKFKWTASVIVEAAEEAPTHQEELKRLLYSFLKDTGHSSAVKADLPLSEMLVVFIEKIGFEK